jgi:soluble lytic murein transglycosylase-like protein
MQPLRATTKVPPPEQTNPVRALGAQSVKTAISVASKRYNVPEWLVKSVAQVESGGNSQAISPKGADGVMQLMPATAARYGVHNVFSVRQNVDAGTRYLHHLLHWSKGSVPLALAAYNAGPQAVIHYGGIPPYTQTMRYVPKVLALAAQAYAKETR